MNHVSYNQDKPLRATAPKEADRNPDGVTNLVDQLGYALESHEKKIAVLTDHLQPVLSLYPAEEPSMAPKVMQSGMSYTHEHLMIIQRRICDATDKLQILIDRFNP
jgi:hypothetical protein